MKFRITATSCCGDNDALLATYPFLNNKVTKEQVMYPCVHFGGCVKYYPTMECFIEVATLKELMELVNICDNEIIIRTDNKPTIEIYDIFRE